MNLETWIEQVQGRLDKATPGPWLRDPISSPRYQVIAHGNEVIAYHRDHARQIDEHVVPNWELLAHAPTDLTTALKIIEVQSLALDKIIINRYLKSQEEIAREALCVSGIIAAGVK